MSKRKVIRYCCTFSNTIRDVLNGRGWEEVGIDDEVFENFWSFLILIYFSGTLFGQIENWCMKYLIMFI